MNSSEKFHSGLVEKGHFLAEREIQDFLGMDPMSMANRVEQKVKENPNYLNFLAGSEYLTALISYWEKYLSQDIQRKLDQAIKTKRNETGFYNHRFPLGMERLNTSEQVAIQRNAVYFQLTVGCSGACSRCGFDAPITVREQIPEQQVLNWVNSAQYKVKGYFCFYYASEPGDYPAYSKIASAVCTRFGSPPYITTRKITDPKWVKYLQECHKKYANVRLSLDGVNPEHAKSAVREIFPDLRDLSMEELEAGDFIQGYKDNKFVIGISIFKDTDLPNHFGINYQESMVITPRGLYNVVPTLAYPKVFPQRQIVVPYEISDKNRQVEAPVQGQRLFDILRNFMVVYDPRSSIGIINYSTSKTGVLNLGLEQPLLLQRKNGAKYGSKDPNDYVLKKFIKILDESGNRYAISFENSENPRITQVFSDLPNTKLPQKELSDLGQKEQFRFPEEKIPNELAIRKMRSL